ncbi:unnamed protein product, partial [Rotaria sordida]
MNNRIRTQKKVYTPTTSAPEPECYLCRIIETGECMIVHRSSIKRIYDDTAEIMVYDRRIEATIEYRGTRDECRRVWEKKEEGQKSNNVDEANDSEGEKDANDDEQIVHLKSLSTSNSLIKSRTPQQKRIPLDPLVKIHHRSSALNSATKKTIDDIQTHIQGTLSFINYPLDLNNFNLIDLSSFRESGQDQKFDDVIYKGINLTRIRGKNIGDYGRQVLHEIFSHEELISSILPPGGSQYARKPLDFEKFEFLHDAMRSKYRIAGDRYDEFYSKLVRPKLADFLADERKRDRK